MTERKGTMPMLKDERGVALVIALLVMTLLTLLGTVFLSTSSTERTIASNEIQAARSFYLSESGTQHAKKALENLNLSDVLDGTTDVFAGGDTANLGGGSYTVQVTNNIVANGFPQGTIPVDPSALATVDGDNIVIVSSTGSFQGSQQAVETIMEFTPTIPDIPSSLTQMSNGSNEFRLEDSSIVSGLEESGNPSCSDQAGLVWGGSSIDTDIGSLEGVPPLRSYSSPPDDPNLSVTSLLDLINTWSSLPGVVTISGQPPATLGTAANPQITVLQGSGDIKDSPFTGYGVLIVTGELEIRNNFEFHGLVIVNSSDRVRIRDADSQGFHGALIVVSNSDTEVRLQDQTQVRYNCDDLENYGRGALPPPSDLHAWRQVF